MAQGEAELHSDLLRLRYIVDNMYSGYTLISLDGEIIDINEKAIKLLGYSNKEELMKLNVQNDLYVYPGRREQLLIILKSKKSVKDFLVKLKSKDNHEIEVLSNIKLIEKDNKPYAIENIFKDVTEERKSKKVQETLLSLLRKANSYSIKDLIQVCVDECVSLSDSEIGYFHIINDDNETISLTEWSSGTKNICEKIDKVDHYPISEAGIWVDCIHQQNTVIHNDYKNEKHKKGLPEGHVNLIRDMAVPIIDEARIAAVVGVGNKKSDYHEFDVYLLNLFAHFIWHIIQRKKTIEDLKDIESKYKALLKK